MLAYIKLTLEYTIILFIESSWKYTSGIYNMYYNKLKRQTYAVKKNGENLNTLEHCMFYRKQSWGFIANTLED